MRVIGSPSASGESEARVARPATGIRGLKPAPTWALVWFSVLLLTAPVVGRCWWDGRWSQRMPLAAELGEAGASEELADFPLLVRLHAGNFPHFLELGELGADLRFVTDDQGSLVYHLEHFDAAGEVALAWVRLPKLGTGWDRFWLYYGNDQAPAGADPRSTYDDRQSLVFHFSQREPLPRDAGSNGNHAADSQASIAAEGPIGDAARFSGSGGVRIPASPSLRIDPAQGWTAMLWLKPDPAEDGVVLSALEGDAGIELVMRGSAWVMRLRQGAKSSQSAPVPVSPQRWQHLAVRLSAQEAVRGINPLTPRPLPQGEGANKVEWQLFVDGVPAASVTAAPAALNPEIRLGEAFKGMIDEVQVSGTARSEGWIRLTAVSQNPEQALLSFGDVETAEVGGGYLGVILGNVTVDGWVVIGLTGVLFALSVAVLAGKLHGLGRVRRANRRFVAHFQSLDTGLPDLCLLKQWPEHADLRYSPLYRIFRCGIDELRGLQHSSRALTPELAELLRVRLDNRVARELQALNRHMVVLTIAISGGPFLGLLGTVVGVMITFAAIAETGDVNINAIAPGIAAALAATVAGLAVAIPALFGYNLLLTQLKAMGLELRLFKDEWQAWLKAACASAGE